MKFCPRPNSLHRFRCDLARREGIEELSHDHNAGVFCQLFDSAIGGSGPTSTQTTQTTSGNARGVSGNKNQYTESGSISVGQKGKYIESGGIDVSGQKVSVAKGGSVTINQAPAAGSSATGLNGSTQPISVPGSTPSPTVPPATPPTAGTDTTSTTTTTSFLDTLKGYWANFSTWQKVGAGAVLVLVLWLVFHKRNKG